ncbi:hypothetical protein WN59_01175 [Salinicoccus sediminis]|uniref:DNA-binding protein n=1 Tax=Salinicoccus sediminis TaxID=1432562 RepID=A0A0M2SMK8_9STAP|nr:small multi-drug export protein [Salinicoccus sediminis]KKK35473.1 hypothetical protein WN59_01175 [Salinicoccus sediminis]
MNISLLIAYIIVFVLSAVPLLEAFLVVPIGIVGGMDFFMTNIIGIAGNLLTLLILIIMMDRIKKWYLDRREKAEKNKSSKSERAENIFRKYGLPGLAFIGPFLVGSHFTALMAVILGGSQKATFWWVTLSVTVSTVTISILFYYGVDIIGLGDRQFLKDVLNQ